MDARLESRKIARIPDLLDLIKRLCSCCVSDGKNAMVDVANALGDAGYNDLTSVHISSQHECIVTFMSTASLERVVQEGFSLLDKTILVSNVLGSILQLHISDFPVWISDIALTDALNPYGSPVSTVQYGHVTTKHGFDVNTGVCFLSFKLGKQCPSSYVQTAGGHVFSVRYKDQSRTCRVCESPGHLAADCSTRQRTPRGTYANRVKSGPQKGRKDQPLPESLASAVKSGPQEVIGADKAREDQPQHESPGASPAGQVDSRPLEEGTGTLGSPDSASAVTVKMRPEHDKQSNHVELDLTLSPDSSWAEDLDCPPEGKLSGGDEARALAILADCFHKRPRESTSPLVVSSDNQRKNHF